MKTIKVRPILIESKNITYLYLDENNTLFSNDLLEQYSPDYLGYNPQELILISLEDEKIEANIDDCINIGGNIKDSFIFKPSLEILDNPYIKKVIARQSQISPDYISKFIEQYNNGNVEYFEIEMNIITMQQSSERYEDNDILVNGEIVESVDYTLDDVIDKTIEKYNKPKLTNGFISIVEKSDNFTKFQKETIDIEIPIGFMNCRITTCNNFIADTNNSANWDSIKFPLPKPKYKWNIKGYKGDINKTVELIDCP